MSSNEWTRISILSNYLCILLIEFIQGRNRQFHLLGSIILSSLDTSKAPGIDGISPVVLKQCAIALTPPLTTLFNLSLTTGSLPLEWRTHLIKPIPKSNDRHSGFNYRPIALLPIISKVLERID